VAEPVRVRAISNEEGNRLLRIVRRSSGSVVTWRRAQMVLLSAQGMDPAQIARVAFTSAGSRSRCDSCASPSSRTTMTPTSRSYATLNTLSPTPNASPVKRTQES
jgi:hypothetical protein